MCARASFLSPSLYPPYFARVLSFSLQTREGTREKERERKGLEFFFETKKNFGQFFLAKKKIQKKKIHGKIDTDTDFFLSFFREKERARVVSFFLSFFLSRATVVVVVVVRRRRNGKRKLESWGAAVAEAGKPCRNASVFLQLCSSSCVSTSSRRGTGTAVSLSGKSGLVAGTGPKTRRLQSLDDIRTVLPIDALCCNEEDACVTIRGVFTYRKDKE